MAGIHVLLAAMSKSASEAALDRLIAPLLLGSTRLRVSPWTKANPDAPGGPLSLSVATAAAARLGAEPKTTAGDHLIDAIRSGGDARHGMVAPIRLESNARTPRIRHPPVSVPVTSRLPRDPDHEHLPPPCERPHDTIAQF
jgi:hypothetical protein